MKLRRAAALMGALVLTFGVVGAVSADSGNPAHIQADVSGNTVTVSGDWAWDKCTGKKIIGWAVAWGDPGWTSNPVPKAEGGGSYYMGDATQGNTVFTTGDPCAGTSGPLPGTLSHTYAEPGTYDVCVIVYDIVKDRDGGYPTGKHGVLAGGPDRNSDNSVEENELKGTSICMSPEIPVVVTDPKISITKTADPDALPAGGGDVTYTYAVKNAGDVTLTGIEVWDDNGTPGDKTDDWKVSCPKTSLVVDESMTCKAEGVEIDETTTNIGTATGHAGDKDTLDADDATVTVAPAPNPRIYISKTPSETLLPVGGGEVTYTYLVWNVGNVPLTGVTLGDDKCTAVTGPTGDTGADGILGLTETWTYTCTMNLTATTTNVGTATGHYGDETTIDAAEATVTVTPPAIGPRIYILKTPSVTELPAAGGPVTYTYLVWNVGDVPLTDITVVDDKCAAVTGPTGDTGADGILGLTEKWTYTCTTTLTATTTNIGTATGYDGEVKTVDADDVTVTVLGGGVAGETDQTTAPPTDALVPTTTDAGGGIPFILLVLGTIGVCAVLLTPSRSKR